MRSLVYAIGLSLRLVCSAEILPSIRQSNLFEVQGAEGEGADATDGVADSSGGARAYYADFALGCVAGGDTADLSKSLIFESAEECCGVMFTWISIEDCLAKSATTSELDPDGSASTTASTTIVPDETESCIDLLISIEFDDRYYGGTSYELTSKDVRGLPPLPKEAVSWEEVRRQPLQTHHICLLNGTYQFALYTEWRDGLSTSPRSYELSLRGRTIHSRIGEGDDEMYSLFEGYGEVVKFSVPFEQFSLEIGIVDGVPTVSPTTSPRPTITSTPTVTCDYNLTISVDFDFKDKTSYDLRSLDSYASVVPKYLGTNHDGYDRHKRHVCLEAGRYQFGLYFDQGDYDYSFGGKYMLRLEDTSQMSTGLVILNRNRDGLDYDDPTVSGFGEIVTFDLPFVRATLTNETIRALPTASPTTSHAPSDSQLPSLNPTPRISTSPSETKLPSLMPSRTPSTVPTSSSVPSITKSPSLEPSTSLAPSLSTRPSLGPSTTLAPSLSCHKLWIELQYDYDATSTSFELISIDQGTIIIPRQTGTSDDRYETRKTFVCLEPGQYQFGLYFEWGWGFDGVYNLKLKSGETIIDRNTVKGFGELVRFDLPFQTLDIEAIGGNPTASPTSSTRPSASTVPSLVPTSSIHPSISQSPSASQAPSIFVPRGATLVGQGICADSSNERYLYLLHEASEFKDGVSSQLCLEKCLSLSFITQLHLRGFEIELIDDEYNSRACACVFDHDPDDTYSYGEKFTEELKRENGFLFGYYGSGEGVGPVSSVISHRRNPFCFAVNDDASFSGHLAHSSTPVINDSTECLNLTVSILTPQVTHQGLYLSWGLYDGSDCVDTPTWLNRMGNGCDWYIDNPRRCYWDDELEKANDNCCACNQFHTGKLWGEKSILITSDNTFDCVDTPDWEDREGEGCDAYDEYCPEASGFEANGYFYDSEPEGEFLRHVESVRENCCACGGGTTSLRSNSILIRNVIDSNICLAKDETYRFQVRAHGWTSVDDTLGHSAVAYALSDHDNQIACGQFEIKGDSLLQSNFTTTVTVDPTNNTYSGCTALNGRDIGRGIELLPLKCFYDARENGLFARNNAWKGACSKASRLDSSCSSVYRMGPNESEEYCKFEEYHQFVSYVGGGVPFSPSSAQGECLWEVWDYDFGTKDPARTEVATCCRSGLGSDGDLTTLSCECSLMQDCNAGKSAKCSAYAAVCCKDASCKCDYKRKACRSALERELATGEEDDDKWEADKAIPALLTADDVCQEAESICSFGQEPSIDGHKCDVWEPLCRELPNSISACHRADEVCCGSEVFRNPHCTCDFLTFAIDELGYEDTESNRAIICAEASTLDSSKSTEKQSLMNLYKTTGGLNWLNSKGWLEEESDHCSWAGISCNPGGHVNVIDLHANNLSGSFPAHLLPGLAHLERINLADNELSGQTSAYVVDNRLFGAEGKCLDANGTPYSRAHASVPTNISSAYEYCHDICQDISTNETDLVGLETHEEEPGLFQCECLYDYGTLPHADPVYFLEIGSNVESIDSCNQACEDAMPESSTLVHVYFDFGDGFCSCVYDEEFAGTTLDDWGGLINGRFIDWIDGNREGTGHVASAGDSCSDDGCRCYPLQRPFYHDFASLSSLRKLKHIDISNNQLSGQFDALLAPSLEYLNASHNNFTSLSRFRSYKPSHKTLRTLDLGTNSIRQNLSNILSNVPPNLVQILLANNTIRGSFPTTLDSLESLQQLDISSNVITGSLPDFSRSCPSLQVLNLSDNARTNDTGLTGDVPASISNLAFLQELHLRNNQLSGGLAGLGGMPQIKELDLSVNRFAGTVPAELGSLAGTIEVLDLSDNEFEGTVPTEIGLFQSETQISLSNNAFERASRSSDALAPLSLCSVDGFDMRRDEALCPAERSILQDFYIRAKGNEWTDISGWMGEHGSYCDWKGVTCDNNDEGKDYIDQRVIRLELPNNGLSGKLSPRIGNLTRLEVLDLSDNDIKGELPVTISNLEKLGVLRLSYNALIGTFPSELSLLEHLEIVHLHSNRIQGNLTIRNNQNPYKSFYGMIQRESYSLPDSPQDAFDKAMFIADCGSPSAFDVPVNCPNCTMCCNSQEDCNPQTTPSLLEIESSGFHNYESFAWVFALLVVGLCVFLWLGSSVVDYVKHRSDPSTFQQSRSMRILDAKYAIETIGIGSVYSFLLSSNIGGWLIALVTIGLQTLMLWPFILAADFDLANDNSDLVYTWKCNRDSITCEDKNDLSLYGWIVFGVLVAAFLSKDIFSGAKMIVLAGKQRHSTQRRVKFFIGGTFLVSITLFILYVSTIYNKTIATSNTDLIINSVAILFIMEIDERVYELIENTNFVKMRIRRGIDDVDSNKSGVTDDKPDDSDMESLLSEFNAFKGEHEDQKIVLEQQQSQINSLLEAIGKMPQDEILD